MKLIALRRTDTKDWVVHNNNDNQFYSKPDIGVHVYVKERLEKVLSIDQLKVQATDNVGAPCEWVEVVVMSKDDHKAQLWTTWLAAKTSEGEMVDTEVEQDKFEKFYKKQEDNQ